MSASDGTHGALGSLEPLPRPNPPRDIHHITGCRQSWRALSSAFALRRSNTSDSRSILPQKPQIWECGESLLKLGSSSRLRHCSPQFPSMGMPCRSHSGFWLDRWGWVARGRGVVAVGVWEGPALEVGKAGTRNDGLLDGGCLSPHPGANLEHDFHFDTLQQTKLHPAIWERSHHVGQPQRALASPTYVLLA